MQSEIRIPVDPRLTPRQQIEPMLKSLDPLPCRVHPHVLRKLRLEDSLLSALTENHEILRPRLCTAHIATEWDFCRDCPRVPPWNSYPDECGRSSYFSKAIVLEPDTRLQSQFDAWEPREVACAYGGSRRLLKCLSKRLVLPFTHYEPRLSYDDCIECVLEWKGVPADSSGGTFENYVCTVPRQHDFLKKIREYAGNPIGFLTLIGSNGTGKSHLGAAILRNYLESPGHGTAGFVEFSKLLAQHRETYERRKDEREENGSGGGILRRMRALDMLILDEVRLPSGNDAEPLLFELIHHRLNHYLPTVILTDVPQGELRQQLGSRIVDRLNQASFAILSFDWGSYRSLAKAKYLERAAFLNSRRSG